MRFIALWLSLAASWAAQIVLRNNRYIFDFSQGVRTFFIWQKIFSVFEIILASGISLIFTLYLYRKFTFFQVSVIQMIYPIGALVIANFYLSEKITVLKILGILFLILGLSIVLGVRD